MKITLLENKNEQAFKDVQLRPPNVGDMIQAERIAGNGASAMQQSAALLSLVGTFDGKKVVMEELLKMDLSDFLELQEAANGLVSKKLAERLSSLSKTEGSATTA